MQMHNNIIVFPEFTVNQKILVTKIFKSFLWCLAVKYDYEKESGNSIQDNDQDSL